MGYPVKVSDLFAAPGSKRWRMFVLIVAPAQAFLILLFLSHLAFGVVCLVIVAVPLLSATLLIAWAERREPAPIRLLAWAALWGSGPAIIGGLILELLTDHAIGDHLMTAPLVEELMKGGAVLILLLATRNVGSILDGAVSEDMLYALTEPTFSQAIGTSISRALIGAFVHLVCSAIVGAGLVIAFQKSRTPIARFAGAAGGYLIAVSIHGLWNFQAEKSSLNGMLLMSIAILALFGALIYLLIERDRTRLYPGFRVAVAYGYLGPIEARILTDTRAWTQYRAAFPKQQRWLVDAYYSSAVRLASNLRPPAGPRGSPLILNENQNEDMAVLVSTRIALSTPTPYGHYR